MSDNLLANIVGFILVGTRIEDDITVYLVDASDSGGPAYSWSSTFKNAHIFLHPDIDVSVYPPHIIGVVSQLAVFKLEVSPLKSIDVSDIPFIKKKRLVASAMDKLTKEEIEALGIE